MVPHLEANVKDGSSTWRQEMSMTKLEQYIKGKNSATKVQLAALNAYEKAAMIFYPNHPDLIQEFILDLSKLVSHSSKDIRKKVNSILQWMTLKKIDNARANLLRR